MNQFGDQMFNPQYVNQSNYLQAQLQHYQNEQDKKVIDAVKAIHDLMEAVNGMDDVHQQEAFTLCLLEIGNHYKWSRR